MFSLKRNLIPIIMTVIVMGGFFTGSNIAYAQTGLEGSPETESPASQAENGSRLSGEDLGFDAVSGLVYDGLTAIGALIASLGGRLLDVSLSWFVWTMYDTTAHFGLDEVIVDIWELIRDIFNLLFIFGLISIGFKIILEVDESGAKRTLGTLIVAALLINFSLYITQVVVDFGNIAAAEIRGQFEFEEKSSVMGLEVSNISSEFIRATSLNNLSSTTLQKSTELATGRIELPRRALGIGDALALGLTVTLMLTVIGFVFAAGAVIMFTRFMYLIFLMIFSPVMFLGFVLPSFKQRSRDWWNALITQTIIGPAYLFMLWVALTATQGLEQGQVAGDISITAFIMSALIVSAFAWAALVVARKIGAYGATQAVSFGERMGRAARVYAGGASFGSAALVGRRLIGKRAYEYAESDAGKNASNSWWGRRKLNIARQLSDASFDARKVGGMGKKLGIGEGIKGYATRTKEIATKEKEYAESLGKVGDDDERVSAKQLEVEATEQAIKSKKQEIVDIQDKRAKAKTDKERQVYAAQVAALRSQIDKHQDDLASQKEDVQKEQYRRQLGHPDRVPLQMNRIKEAKDSLKKLLPEYVAARDSKNTAEQERLKVEIAEKRKEIADAEKEAKKYDGGYASIVENLGGIKNFFLGRNAKQNENAGDEIRKEYKKKVKSKD